jgi:hypothetical protein
MEHSIDRPIAAAPHREGSADRRRASPAGAIGSPEDAADYLADMIAELEQIARVHGHRVLGQILEIAHIEARRALPADGREKEAG